MHINVIKLPNGSFMPAYPSDYDNAKKLKVGEEHHFVHKKIRNPKFHRKYFSMIRMLFDQQEKFKSERAFRRWLQSRAGYYEATETDKGIFYDPISIAYDSLDNDKFQELFELVTQVAYEIFALDNEEIERDLIDYM